MNNKNVQALCLLASNFCDISLGIPHMLQIDASKSLVGQGCEPFKSFADIENLARLIETILDVLIEANKKISGFDDFFFIPS